MNYNHVSQKPPEIISSRICTSLLTCVIFQSCLCVTTNVPPLFLIAAERAVENAKSRDLGAANKTLQSQLR